jgi:hypothetical protein
LLIRAAIADNPDSNRGQMITPTGILIMSQHGGGLPGAKGMIRSGCDLMTAARHVDRFAAVSGHD